MALLGAGRSMQLLASGRRSVSVLAGRQLAARAPAAGAAAAPSHRHHLRQQSTTTTAVSAVDAPPSEDGPLYAGPAPVFAAFNIYKGAGALNVKPIKPKWGLTPGGAHQIESNGSFLFELAPAVQGSGSGPGERRYDWANKVTVALSPLELAHIVATPNEQHTFYHDTFKGTARQGSITKQLRWSAAPEGRSGYFLNASSTSSESDVKRKRDVSVSVTPQELYVLQALVSGCMPYMYGFDAAFQQPS